MITKTSRDQLAAEGWTLLRTKSYQAAQRKLDLAKSRLAWVEEQLLYLHGILEKEWAEERRLRDRLEFVYGKAIEHGASVEELRGPGWAPRVVTEPEGLAGLPTLSAGRDCDGDRWVLTPWGWVCEKPKALPGPDSYLPLKVGEE